MHGQIHSAWSVRKHHTTSLRAFDEAGGLSAGTVAAGRVTFRPSAVFHPAPGLLQIGSDGSMPRVDILETYQGANGDLIDAAAAAGAAGIVMAGAGAGSLTPSQATAARRVARTGVPVVVASRTGAGLVGPVAADDVGFVSAGALSPLRARLLLILALARDMSSEEIARLFALVSASEQPVTQPRGSARPRP
jgi:L-asparaginase